MASKKRSMSDVADASAMYKEWDEISCPICMDHPHNAVLLICSSHSKGCRSYVCDTSYRHSNCLDRFKKLKEENADGLSVPPSWVSDGLQNPIDTSAEPVDLETWIRTGRLRMGHRLIGNGAITHVGVPGGSGTNDANSDTGEQEATELGWPILGDNSVEKLDDWSNLKCPLCRGTILGSKVVEDVRKYLNQKSRSCSHESCSFSGNYRELRRHARIVHPAVCPADVDPSRERAWRHFEDQREYNDIVSAIQSAMPGAVVLGDYVIEIVLGDYVIENGDRMSVERDRGGGAGLGGRWLSTFFLFHMIGMDHPGADLGGGIRSRVLPRHRRASGTRSRGRYLWGENLLGLQNDNGEDEGDEDEDEDEDNEPELNILSDAGDDASPHRRRRRRLTGTQPEEDHQ